jgi:hypothetical protein
MTDGASWRWVAVVAFSAKMTFVMMPTSEITIDTFDDIERD